MRGFDGYFGVELLFANAAQRLNVVFRDAFRFRRIPNVFAQVREDRSDMFFFQAARGRERVAQIFAGHEARNGAAHEFVFCGVIAQPGILRSRQQ